MELNMPLPAEKKEKSRVARLLRIIFVVAAFILVGITVLANMGGSNDSLKESVETFMSNLFRGRPVQVGTLVHMGFFPKTGFDAQDIRIFSGPAQKHEIARMDKIHMFMGFWNVAFRRPRIAHFYLEGFDAVRGALWPEKFSIEKIFIDHDIEAKRAVLRGNGKIGLHPWSFAVDLAVHEGMDFFGTGRKYNYVLARALPFVLDIADIHFAGRFVNTRAGYYKIEDFTLSRGEESFGGTLVLSLVGESILKIKGDIEDKDDANWSVDVLLDYAQHPVKISGDITGDTVVVDRPYTPPSLPARIRDIFGYDTHYNFTERYDVDIMFNIGKLSVIAFVLENIKFPLRIENQNIKFGPVEGRPAGGQAGFIMPPLLFVPEKETGRMVYILQDGPLDVYTAQNFVNLYGTLGAKTV